MDPSNLLVQLLVWLQHASEMIVRLDESYVEIRITGGFSTLQDNALTEFEQHIQLLWRRGGVADMKVRRKVALQVLIRQLIECVVKHNISDSNHECSVALL